ncbi:GntR family transcriptional regulator [Streptomyces turgidiscabies]|uniref:Transcriptional regulator, GntR family n=1 Tax=Streptomyces turgidiscabies (strain Car8) TaxID=698760 RepID=L7F9P9_STRT8|nr:MULTISPECIES: GntR family transcriptional regulator [Streptomyces]ELP67844.1 transcriptional regulator, GntR family [Streptomyces turgidiscabies Car8]MDX3494959.1 GntR family transcriptional regulator [Streptomyces turgidiscabies]GAQ70832.1 HTH-type transcriptional repressor CsiR [Streptomyces turgidiscabies]
MQHAGPQGAHGSPETGAPASRPGAVRVPPQLTAADVDRGRGPGTSGPAARDTAGAGTGAGAPVGAARGEHTHSEQPLPVPRTEQARPARSGPAQTPPARTRSVVQRSSVRGQILDALRTALVGGELAPGEVYSAPALGDRFGVSATPVREAMQQLALEGAVEVVPNRGFRVVERGARELAELAEIRALIELPVLLRLARTVPAERWTELRPLAEATARAASTGCRATYAETDRAFHRAVLSLAGNTQLVQLADDLHRRAQWPLVDTKADTSRTALMADADDHMALLNALAARDAAVVQSLVRNHVTGAH